jgi:hypothetical protein
MLVKVTQDACFCCLSLLDMAMLVCIVCLVVQLELTKSGNLLVLKISGKLWQ